MVELQDEKADINPVVYNGWPMDTETLKK